ncbi:MAG: hypothetical protein RSG52_08685 [Terrisporobacter sp.]|uniref:hypothetical protein n=1 Tax=Terrisporobacter sp. TaxID=1965305 RepID=UPI002FCAC8BE
MKSKVVKDMIIYILLPVFLFNIGKISDLTFITQVTGFIAIIYTAYTRYIENRVNTSGVLFFITFVSCTLITHNVEARDAYFYNTALLLAIVLIIPAFRVFNKDISIVILKDALVAFNKNSLAIMRLLKKKSIIDGIKKISSIVEVNLGIIVLLRMVNIIIFNGLSESYVNFISRLMGIILVCVVIFRITKLSSKSKEIKEINKSSNNNNSNNNNNNNRKGKIINFNNFK